MLTWKIFDSDSNQWNRWLVQAADHNVFQSYEWGEYKRLTGWSPIRLICTNKNQQTVGMCQLLLKSLPFGLGFIWAAGGPIFKFGLSESGKPNELLEGLIRILHKDYPRALVRFHSHEISNGGLAFGFNRVCKRPYFNLNSGFSVKINFCDIRDSFRSSMTAKHRYYTKKSLENKFDWQSGNSDDLINDLSTLHDEMVKDKKLPALGMSQSDLITMRDTLGDSFLILTGYLDNQPATSCLVLHIGSHVFYMVAATGRIGRETSAAYAMIETLLSILKQRNMLVFDFGGIDPINSSAAGVNHFKCGFGGQIVEHLGEWESAKTEPLRVLINLAIRLRGGRA